MTETPPSPLGTVITIDDERIKSHLDRVVRGSVEETLNALLDAEADRLCNAQRYERSEARRDRRAGAYAEQEGGQELVAMARQAREDLASYLAPAAPAAAAGLPAHAAPPASMDQKARNAIEDLRNYLLMLE